MQATVKRETRRIAHQDVMNLTSVIFNSSEPCMAQLTVLGVSSVENNLYTIGLFFVLQT